MKPTALRIFIPFILLSFIYLNTSQAQDSLKIVKHHSVGAAMSAALNGDVAYVGIGQAVQFVDISDLTSPYQFNEFYHGHDVTAVTYANNTVFIGAFTGEMKIIDVTNRHNAVELASLEINDVREIRLFDNHAWVSAGHNGLYVLDVSDPSNPTMALEGFGASDQTSDAVVYGNYAYVAKFYGGLEAYDISDPANPVSIGSYAQNNTALKIDIVDNNLFLSDQQGRITIYTIEDSNELTFINEANVHGQATDIAIDGTTAFATSSSNVLSAVDISDFDNPVRHPQMEIYEFAHDVKLRGTTAFVGSSSGLFILDVSNPVEPSVISKFDRGTAPQQIVKHGDYLITKNFSKLYVYDVSNPVDIHLVSETDTPPLDFFNNIQKFSVQGDYLYHPALSDTMYIYDLSDPAGLSRWSNSVAIQTETADFTASTEDFLLISTTSGLDIYDLSVPDVPAYASTIEVPGWPRGLTMDGTNVYVSAGVFGSGGVIEVWSLENASEPEKISEFTVDEKYFTELTIEGSTLYSVYGGRDGSTHFHGIRAIDISDPTDLSLLGEINIGGADGTTSGPIVYDNGMIYSPIGAKGLIVYDVSDPANITEKDRIMPFENGGTAQSVGVAVDGETVYLAHAVGGIFVLHWGEGNFTSVEKDGAGVASGYALEQNYPNPFNPSTTLSFSIPESGHVNLTVFNVLGQEVAQLVSDQLAAGSYNVEFNGAGLPSGIYLYRISSGDYTATKKMMLLK